MKILSVPLRIASHMRRIAARQVQNWREYLQQIYTIFLIFLVATTILSVRWGDGVCNCDLSMRLKEGLSLPGCMRTCGGAFSMGRFLQGRSSRRCSLHNS